MIYKEAVSTMYKPKESLLILGLTGRTGAGCTTVANILNKKFSELHLEYKPRNEDVASDVYKYEIVKKFMSHEDRWIPFTVIEGTCVILSFVIEYVNSKEALVEYLTNLQKNSKKDVKIANFETLKKDIGGISYIFNDSKKYSSSKLDKILNTESIEIEQIDDFYTYYVEKLPQYRNRLKSILKKYKCSVTIKHPLQDEPTQAYDLYTYLFQIFGNNIRKSGDPFNSKFDQQKFHSLAERMDKWINLIIKRNRLKNISKTRICIDAIRNSYESQYLKEKHRGYYLLSISTDESIRDMQLSNLNADERINIDLIESSDHILSEEKFYRQDINACFEVADIHIYNESNTKSSSPYSFTTLQLLKYICLMIHPGLITPTRIERCMQLAYNAKFNSGCISRQVGAVVTDQNYSTKSIGWNDIPQGQLSCNLRDFHNCYSQTHGECFSEYERKNPDFRDAISKVGDQFIKNKSDNKLEGRNYSFCFKDIYNGMTNKSNQVHTRALHAEENAFLQISKYGGSGVEDGILFSTASPCELCSKKAYQLGIREIFYIDPYPGISQTHILSFGDSLKKNRRPIMKQYYGAIGDAYIALYKPLLPYKDELQLITGLDCKKAAGINVHESNSYGALDIKYNLVEFTCEFINRHEIKATRHVKFEITGEIQIKEFERMFTWTGSSYSRTVKTDSNDDSFEVKDHGDAFSPYYYTIIFKEIKEKGSIVEYSITTYCNDESELMHPYVSHTVRNPTDILKIKAIFPSIDKKVFANKFDKLRTIDSRMEIPHVDKRSFGSNFNNTKNSKGDITVEYTIEDPAINYTYGVIWEFI